MQQSVPLAINLVNVEARRDVLLDLPDPVPAACTESRMVSLLALGQALADVGEHCLQRWNPLRPVDTSAKVLEVCPLLKALVLKPNKSLEVLR